MMHSSPNIWLVKKCVPLSLHVWFIEFSFSVIRFTIERCDLSTKYSRSISHRFPILNSTFKIQTAATNFAWGSISMGEKDHKSNLWGRSPLSFFDRNNEKHFFNFQLLKQTGAQAELFTNCIQVGSQCLTAVLFEPQSFGFSTCSSEKRCGICGKIMVVLIFPNRQSIWAKRQQQQPPLLSQKIFGNFVDFSPLYR